MNLVAAKQRRVELKRVVQRFAGEGAGPGVTGTRSHRGCDATFTSARADVGLAAAYIATRTRPATPGRREDGARPLPSSRRLLTLPARPASTAAPPRARSDSVSTGSGKRLEAEVVVDEVLFRASFVENNPLVSPRQRPPARAPTDSTRPKNCQPASLRRCRRSG